MPPIRIPLPYEGLCGKYSVLVLKYNFGYNLIGSNLETDSGNLTIRRSTDGKTRQIVKINLI
jgi:hypothetical protein